MPECTLYFYGHLFESVHLRLPPLQDFPDHLGVYSLKDLRIFMDEVVREEDICAGGGTRTSLSAGARARKGGGGREPTMHLKKGRQLIRTYQSGTSSIGGERLIRTNWRLQKLYFQGEEDYEYPPPLDIKDFDGLRRLEDLSLHGWDCSEGQLSKILWLLAGTLKKLDVGWITNVRLDELADYNLPDSLQQSGDDTSGKNGSRGIRTNDTASKELVLSRLESIKIDTHIDPIDHYLTVLVRGCPSLVSLEARLDDSVLDSTRLANNLRVHCPQLSALVLLVPLKIHHIETLLRHGAPNGLCKLTVFVRGPKDGLVAAIVQHRETLEHLEVHSEGDDSLTTMQGYLRLLVECTRLRRFELITSSPSHLNINELWGQQTWGCRELQELHLSIDIHGGDIGTYEQQLRRRRQHRTEAEKEEFFEVLSRMAWKTASLWFWTTTDPAILRQALELVRAQSLDKIKMLSLNRLEFQPIGNGHVQ